MGNTNQKMLTQPCSVLLPCPLPPPRRCCRHLPLRLGPAARIPHHVHEAPDDPTDNMFQLPLPGWLQQTHLLHPYMVRLEGLHFGDGQLVVFSWASGHRSREKPRGKLHPITLSHSNPQPACSLPCKNTSPFSLYLGLSKCSEPLV